MSIIKDRRIGRFYVSIDSINHMTAEGRRALFGTCVVLKAELQFSDDSIEYTAICDAFANCGEDQYAIHVPFYVPTFEAKYDDAGTVTDVVLIGWKRFS
jgi:hypothetical protein